MRARPVMFSVSTGLRLWGIAEEPFWPGEKYSSASRNSVRCRWRISTASRSAEEAITPRVAKYHRMAVARNNLGRDRFRRQTHRLRNMLFHRWVDTGERADRAGNCAGRNLGPRGDEPFAVCAQIPRNSRQASLQRSSVRREWRGCARSSESSCALRRGFLSPPANRPWFPAGYPSPGSAGPQGRYRAHRMRSYPDGRTALRRRHVRRDSSETR